MFNGWKTLRVRLTLWYLLLLLVTLSLFSGFLYFRLERTLLQSADDSLRLAVIQALAYVADDNTKLAFADNEEYRHTSRHLNQAGFSLRLLDPGGTPVGGFGRQNGLPWPARPEPGLTTAEIEDSKYQRQSWRTYTQSIADPQGGARGWIQASKALTPVQEALSNLYWSILVSVPVLLLVAGTGGIFLAYRALKPIDTVTSIAEEIGADDLSRRIGYTGPRDEVGRLAATFDSMLDRIEQAFETERRFTADASHELRTPLTAIKGRIGVALSRMRSVEEHQATLRDIEHEADRLIRLSNDLLLLARIDQGNVAWEFEEINTSNLLSSVTDQMAPVADQGGIQIKLDLASNLSMRGSIDHVIRVFLNIIDNAIKYSPVGGRIDVVGKDRGESIQIDIVDQGPGIPPDALSRLTERFFRAEEDRSRKHGGSGLGLSIANEIVRCHGGCLTFASRLGSGTCVSLIFMRDAKSSSEQLQTP
ncbi:MAG: HAMP domain-containing sensor histidine kinase [Pseudomonadota bacterium]